MSISPVVSINHPDLTEKILEPAKITNPQAIILAELLEAAGDSEKNAAWRLNECGEVMMKAYLCSKDNVMYFVKTHKTCHLPSCYFCAGQRAIEIVERYSAYLARLSKQHTFVRIIHPPNSKPYDLKPMHELIASIAPEDSKDAKGRIRVLSYLSLSDTQNWITTAIIPSAYHSGMNSQLTKLIEEKFPGETHLVRMDNISSKRVVATLKKMVEPNLPDGARARAEMQMSLIGIRRLHVRGVKGELLTNKLDTEKVSNSGKQSGICECHLRPCIICGELPDKETRLLSEHHPMWRAGADKYEFFDRVST
jgi:hypothetical protein